MNALVQIYRDVSYFIRIEVVAPLLVRLTPSWIQRWTTRRAIREWRIKGGHVG